MFRRTYSIYILYITLRRVTVKDKEIQLGDVFIVGVIKRSFIVIAIDRKRNKYKLVGIDDIKTTDGILHYWKNEDDWYNSSKFKDRDSTCTTISM